MKRRWDVLVARVVFGYHNLSSRVRSYFRKHRVWVAAGLLILVAVGTLLPLPSWQAAIGPYFSTNTRFDSLRNFMLAVGGALVGATAIASSFVLFAMQVNVERMPHGLFRRLSSDLRLLSAFAGTFTVAIGVAAGSLSSDQHYAAALLSGSFEAIALTLVLFAYAYRRALRLINPIEQLQIVLSDVHLETGRWDRRATRAAALINLPEESADSPASKDQADLARTTFFKANPAWNQSILRGIRYATAYSRYYAEQGDHEVSAAALKTIVNLNVIYVRTKGKTFFTDNPFIDTSLSTDGIVNNSLEQIRQNLRISLARDDQQQIEQNLRTFAALGTTYASIEYPGINPTKTHAVIAAHYLSDAVEYVLPRDMPDAVMEGVRIMGALAGTFISTSTPLDAATLIDKIGFVGCVRVAQEKFRPVTLTAMEQLAKITLQLLRVEHHQLNFTSDNVQESVALIAKLFLSVPDQPLISTHSTYLAPYYSGGGTLRSGLVALTNALIKDDVDVALADNVSSNLAEWAEKLAQSQQSLLLLAIEKRSKFTFDLIAWIVGVTEVLLAASTGPGCSDHDKDKLRESALHLIYTLSWLPRDRESLSFLAAYNVSDSLFTAAYDARFREALDVYEAARKMLLSWAMEAGALQRGWGTLEKCLLALAALALPEAAVIAQLKAEVASALNTPTAPVMELRERAARGLRETARDLRDRPFTIDKVKAVLERHDRKVVRTLLSDLADILDPPAPQEPVHGEGR